MAERTQYAPGTFSWTDLTTPDQDAAKAFYSALFGWEAADVPMGDGAVYSMQRLDGKDVAAISPQPQQQRDMGLPPMWNSYVTVESADDAANKAGQLGATVHAPPFDVFDSGRMAVIADPQGAFFEVWEPKQHIGAGLINGPGALSWNELQSPDIEAAGQFYAQLFGWTAAPFEGSPQPYLVISNQGRGNGGIRQGEPGVPPSWLVYFGIDDIDSGLNKLEQLGGARIEGPIDLPMAKIAIVRDPQGAVFALYAGQFEP